MPNRRYRLKEGVFVDVNLRDVESHMLNMVRKGTYISLKNDNYVTGRSWEMAGYMALHGVRGRVFSGTVEPIETSSTAAVPGGAAIMFGPVPGIDVKKKIYNKLMTYKDFPGHYAFPHG